jgi:hypothetical protein
MENMDLPSAPIDEAGSCAGGLALDVVDEMVDH